ncbi:MAG: type II secretion system GspH family protein [Candidatus Omnitrophica bacterium]|nr:type II secretion system GspH family protein [Candidatus Omnitrophota bacterium]MBU4333807.1 type II secretion system GspH family protein [Candidatus Omnitrophota bacterium]
MKNDHGFTLTEIVITTLIIGIIAAFSIPNFNKMYEKEISRKAQLNMQTIHAALDIYRMRHGNYPDVTVVDWSLTELNANLDINIIDNEFTYLYGTQVGNNLEATRQLPLAQRYVLSDQVIPAPFADGIHCTPANICP